MSAHHETNAPALESWVESANSPDCPFPIQNLPYGRFRSKRGGGEWAIGVAIGDQVLDLRRAGLLATADMAEVLCLSIEARRSLREAISRGLARNSADRERLEPALLPLAEVELGLPCEVRNYSDFFIGIHHAASTGSLYRPAAPLLPNYKWVPIGYHGRASTLQASGVDVLRPLGQVMLPDAQEPVLRPTNRLDFELEMGIIVGRSNDLGCPIPIERAEEHIFGLTLLNDWSARDVQSWEAQPLGPFLAKSFATSLSPWIVTTEALAPFRRPFHRPQGDPRPLRYLDDASNRDAGAVDVQLEVILQTPAMRSQGHEGDRIVRSNFAGAAYWTMAQLVTHHTVNGCRLMAGDLLGTGTLSGPAPGQAGCLLEITNGGQNALRLSTGEERIFLEDGDSVVLRAYCERPGHRRIGFGECRATVRATVH